MAPLRLISFHLLLGWIALVVNADFYDESGGTTTSVKAATLGFSHEPDDVVVARGQSARLDCLVRLPPPVDRSSNSGQQQSAKHFEEAIAFDILWFQDGLPVLLPDQRRHLLANGSLYFDKVLHKRTGRSSSDEGIYHCLAQQKESSSSAPGGGGALVSRNASVRVAVLGREFTTNPANETAQVDDPVRLNCEIESVPEANITWEKDGVSIESAVSQNQIVNGSRFVMLNSGILHIYHVQPGDAGNYRCVARNEMADKDRKSQVGRLTVIPALDGLPQFIFPPPNDLWVVQGNNATIECLVTANAVVRWTLNSTEIPLTTTTTTTSTSASAMDAQPGFLSLTNVDPSMAGDYACVATAANVTVTRNTPVRVATLPEFIRVPKSQVFPTAKTVRFECEVIGTPYPDIRWLKDGKVVPIGGRIKNRIRNSGTFSELVLSNTVTSDSGIYQCQAQNRAGVVSVSARLLVNVSEGTRPEPPSNLKAEALTPTAILLTWNPPRNVPVDDVKAYTVHYMALSAGLTDEIQEVAINSSYKIENLKRNANYSFYVRAYVRKAASDPSDKLIFNLATAARPTDDPPSTRPTPRTLSLVTLIPLSPNTLKVTWRKFTSSVPFYKIQYRRHRGKEFDIEVVKGDVLEYTITGLHPGKKYDVRVVPGSMNVSGQWYTVEMPRVMANATTSPPANLLAAPAAELMAVNSTSVLVTWEDMGPSSGRQKAQFIQLTYRTQGGRDTSPVVFLPASGSYWITDLKAGTVYEFQLTSGHEGQPDGPSTSATIRTLWDSGIDHEEEESDSEPRAIRVDVQVLSSSVIQVSWHPLPPDTLTNVLYYTVRYVLIPEDNTPVKFQFVRSTGHQIKLANLTAHALYQINIRSHDRQGRSSTYSSPASEARTLPDRPGPPLNLTFTATDGTVQLAWKAPSPTNGNILGYAILTSTDPSTPIESWTRQEDTGTWMRSPLRGLNPGTVYYVRMQAQTSVGWGPLTEPLSCSIPPPAASSDSSYDIVRFQEQYLGAFIGLAVSVGLAVACSISMFLRARCIKRMSLERTGSPQVVPATDVSRPPAVAVANGLAVCNGFQHRHKQSMESVRRNGPLGSREREDLSLVEMEAFVPMLATIPVEESCHLDTKGGYQTGSRGSQKEDSLCNGSIRGGGTGRLREDENDEDEEDPADRSELPLLSLQSSSRAPLDGTILSQSTETTCLSLDYSGRNRRRRRQEQDDEKQETEDGNGHRGQQQRQGSLHSHDSSLHSLDSRTNSSSDSSRSLRGQDDNDTGICHADHQMNDSGLVVAVVTGSSNNNRSTPKGSGELVMT